MLIGRSCINLSYIENIGALYILEVGECERSNIPQVQRSEKRGKSRKLYRMLIFDLIYLLTEISRVSPVPSTAQARDYIL